METGETLNDERTEVLAILSLMLAQVAVVRGAEKLDRGLVALRAADGSVFLSWRLLKDDPQDITFAVARRDSNAADASRVMLSGQGSPQTHFIDRVRCDGDLRAMSCSCAKRASVGEARGDRRCLLPSRT